MKMKKKFLSLLLALCLVMALVPMTGLQKKHHRLVVGQVHRKTRG